MGSASFIEYLGVGKLEKDSKQPIIDFVVEKFSHLINTIISSFFFFRLRFCLVFVFISASCARRDRNSKQKLEKIY